MLINKVTTLTLLVSHLHHLDVWGLKCPRSDISIPYQDAAIYSAQEKGNKESLPTMH